MYFFSRNNMIMQLGYIIFSTFGYCLDLITNLKVVRDQTLLFEKRKREKASCCALIGQFKWGSMMIGIKKGPKEIYIAIYI